MSFTPQHQGRKAVAPNRTHSAQTDALKHLHVLLVEDEPDVTSFFLSVLQAGGASVQLAVSAQEGSAISNFPIKMAAGSFSKLCPHPCKLNSQTRSLRYVLSPDHYGSFNQPFSKLPR